MCSISLLLIRSLCIMYVTGICGNPWISAYQCKPSSHSLPLLNIRVFPALMGTHLTSIGVLTGSNIVCPVWKVNAMAQLSSALLHWLRLSPHLSVPLTMTLFPVSMTESYSIMNLNSIPWSIHLFSLCTFFTFISGHWECCCSACSLACGFQNLCISEVS